MSRFARWKTLAALVLGIFLLLLSGLSAATAPLSEAVASPGADHAADVVLKQSAYLRSRDELVESTVLRPKSKDPDEVVALVREHWATLRAKGLAAAYPILILLNKEGDQAGTLQYTFKWKDAASRVAARTDGELTDLERRIQDRADRASRLTAMNEVYQGFDYRRFPATGGVELLRGKCNSHVTLAIDGREMDVNVLNGFVLMHRSPGHTAGNDGPREMYVEILQHGGDIRLDLPGNTASSGLQILRVGQNEQLPQYGLIRAQTRNADFPATAMWVVHWRIWTNLGTVITDPQTPLVFGPTTVHHYPPVGTEFHSTNGPVKLIHEATGKVVGTLVPRELTAFDIVVTKDDEIESVALNSTPQDLVKLFEQRTASYHPGPEGH